MNDEPKKNYSANWIIKLAKKTYIPSVNEKPLYLTIDEVMSLFSISVITEIDETQCSNIIYSKEY